MMRMMMADEPTPPLTDEERRFALDRAAECTCDQCRLLLELERERGELQAWYDSANAIGVVVKPPEETEEQRADRLLGAWLTADRACEVMSLGDLWRVVLIAVKVHPTDSKVRTVARGDGNSRAAAILDALAKAGGKDG